MLLYKTEQHQEEQGQMRFMTLNNVRMYVHSNNAQPHIIFRRKFSGRSFLHVNYTGHTLPYSK